MNKVVLFLIGIIIYLLMNRKDWKFDDDFIYLTDSKGNTTKIINEVFE